VPLTEHELTLIRQDIESGIQSLAEGLKNGIDHMEQDDLHFHVSELARHSVLIAKIVDALTVTMGFLSD
jgi:hypothetical protein